MIIESVFIVRKLNSENDERVMKIADVIKDVCKRNDILLIEDENDLRIRTFIIAIGGDGTVLYAMNKEIGNSYTLGINLGRVGFLADLDYSDVYTRDVFEKTIEDILVHPTDNLVITERTVLELTQPILCYSPALGFAINEFSFANRSADALIEYRLKIGKFDAGVHRANSVIISTATGSTAYNLSAGGALMMPEGEGIQITPVAPLKLTSRPIVVPPGNEITVEILNHQYSTIRADGQELKDGIDFTKPFVIGAHRFKAKLCHMKSWNFFDVLMEKLNWEKN